jgi:VIT1/CCC1 family predicted Fe2+/Mn2+ transporter
MHMSGLDSRGQPVRISAMTAIGIGGGDEGRVPAIGGRIKVSMNHRDAEGPPRRVRTELADMRNYIFGSSAAIITDVSLIVGLGSAKAGKGPILAGLLTIAVADNISDSLGIHLYKESEGYDQRLSLLSTTLNFLSRLLISFTFIAIVLWLPMAQAVYVGLVWGLLLVVIISYLISRRNRDNPIKEMVIHVLIAAVVVALSRWLGHEIAMYFQAP